MQAPLGNAVTRNVDPKKAPVSIIANHTSFLYYISYMYNASPILTSLSPLQSYMALLLK